MRRIARLGALLAVVGSTVAVPGLASAATPTLTIRCYDEPLVRGYACYRLNEDGTLHSFWVRPY